MYIKTYTFHVGSWKRNAIANKKVNLLEFFWREPFRCVWSSVYCISAVFTQHIKSDVLLQLVTFGYMFRPLPGHHQANKEW